MPKERLEENKNLPKCWQIQHGAYYYRVPISERKLWGDATRVRLGSTLDEAMEFFKSKKQLVDLGLPAITSVHRTGKGTVVFRAPLWERLGYKRTCGISIGALQAMYTTARFGAELRDLSFDIHPKHLIELANRASGRCMLTGIEWDFEESNASGKRPWAPSLDRIDASEGYSPSNCRLVCIAVNIALSDFGDKVLLRIALALANRLPHVRATDTQPKNEAQETP